ncbi:MAG: phosphotransferase [Clostridiales bacterium]|nr:phosphotransferase [Clostridiales bacterium]
MEHILSQFGLPTPARVIKIYESAWDIDDAYILKTSEKQRWLDKSIRLSRLLLAAGVPVVEYINTPDAKPYIFQDEKYWSVMKKIHGSIIDPFLGNPGQNGTLLGQTLAKLHRALKNIENQAEVYVADFHEEFQSWIQPALKKSNITFADGVIDSVQAFLQRDCKSLPRQLIHRDMHPGNLLFENGTLSGYLDFDLCQINARVFDIVYLGCSLLVENYQNKTRLSLWREIFVGILQGYSELLPLQEDELQALPALFIFDEVLFTAFFADLVQLETAKNCVEMTNWLHANIAGQIPPHRDNP